MTGLPPPDRKALEAALRRLPRLQRTVYIAACRDGLAYEEIARQTGLSVARVERLLARALIGLDRRLSVPRRPWWRRWR
jgi:RNA polymerase sigma factor (sigma-70 family)